MDPWPSDPDQGLRALVRNIRLIVFDFDGVFTDNTVVVLEDGREAVTCWRGDGLGLARIRREAGTEMTVLSTERNDVVLARCRKLGLPCRHGCDDKKAALEEMMAERGLDPQQVAYMGNDVNDAECLAMVGLPVVPSDAHRSVMPLGRLRTPSSGGRGAVRDFCDFYCEVIA